MTIKTKKTFAARARDIEKKYPRRATDKIEQQDFESDMDALLQEQEEMRSQLGLDKEESNVKEFKVGGPYENNTFGILSSSDYGRGLINNLGYTLPSGEMNIEKYEAPASSLSQKHQEPNLNVIGDIIPGLGDAVDSRKSISSGKIPSKSDSTSLTPYLVSAGAGILGNVLQSALARKPKTIQTPSYSPKELDLYDRVLQAKKRAGEQSTASMVQSRNLGLNAGATLANQSANQSGIESNLGDQLTNIDIAEKQYNAEQANKAGLANAENKFKTDILNEQSKQQYAANKMEGLSGAIGIIPELMSDINKIKAQDTFNKRLSSKDKASIELLKSLYGNYSNLEFNPFGDVTSVKYKGK